MSMKLDVNGWCCNIISNSCTSVIWWLNMQSCLFRSPFEICAVIIHECLIRYAFNTGWKQYWLIGVCLALFQSSCLLGKNWREGVVFSEFVCVCVCVNYNAMWWWLGLQDGLWISLLCQIPQLYWWFMHDILYITRLGLSCGLIFNGKVVSITLYMDNSIFGSPL